MPSLANIQHVRANAPRSFFECKKANYASCNVIRNHGEYNQVIYPNKTHLLLLSNWAFQVVRLCIYALGGSMLQVGALGKYQPTSTTLFEFMIYSQILRTGHTGRAHIFYRDV